VAMPRYSQLNSVDVGMVDNIFLHRLKMHAQTLADRPVILCGAVRCNKDRACELIVADVLPTVRIFNLESVQVRLLEPFMRDVAPPHKQVGRKDSFFHDFPNVVRSLIGIRKSLIDDSGELLLQLEIHIYYSLRSAVW